MKIIALFISMFFLGLWASMWNDTVACTMEYAPVCASVQVQCIQAPCPAIQQTFGNKCMMSANPNAQFLYEGECVNPQPDLSNCESYFDGCNNCSVVDWKISACTEMYCQTPLWSAKCTKYKSESQDLSKCESYFDGCNTCTVDDWKIWGCTKMFCQTTQEPRCLKYKDWVWMANPASVYCQKNWWNLVIENNENGRYWICFFDDGSSCEERAYYRWECKQIWAIEKYLSWYIHSSWSNLTDIKNKVSFLQNLKNKFTQRYRIIAHSIQNFIETIYVKDFEKKKFTLQADWKIFPFSIQIPKSWENKYSERIIINQLDQNNSDSTLIFEYKDSQIQSNMIFSISVTSTSNRKKATREWEFNMQKIEEYQWYVFYYSQALDMPYTDQHANTYAQMVSQIKEIILSFVIMQ